MNVTTVSGYSNILDDKIHLNNKFLSKIRFILATEFDKLFLEKEDSLIKLADNEIVLKLKNFEYALEERLNVLSIFVQEKGQNSVLKFISDKHVLDINNVNEQPMAILDKFDEIRNDEIPFDLFFCDFTKQMKYGVVIINKKDHNKSIYKESKFSINIKMSLNILFENLGKLLNISFFLSQKIRTRYYNIVMLICFGMTLVKNNSQSSLTRTGKVYKTFQDGSLWFKNHRGKGVNISAQIFETKTGIQIESDIPVASVELIEEVKNEREELEEMNEAEFKKRWNEAIIDELKYNHDEDVAQRLKVIRSEKYEIFKDLKELNIKYEKIEKELKELKNIRKDLKESKELKEKVDKIDEIFEEIKDIKMGNNKERKGKFSKISEMILHKDTSKKPNMSKHKYHYEGISNRYEMINGSEEIKNIEIDNDKRLLEELHQLNDKYKKGEIKKINIEENKKIKEELKLFDKYKKIEKEIKLLENKLESLEVSIELKEKINERDKMAKNIEIKDKNYKELDEKLDMIENEQKKIWEEKLEKIKAENEKILKENLENKRKEMLEKYNDFIVGLKERWFRALFYHLPDEVLKCGNKNSVIIELSKENEEKEEACTSTKTIKDEEEEHFLYFDKNSLIGKPFLLHIYGKENAIKLHKEKKDSAIFVNLNDKNIFEVNEGKFSKDNYINKIKWYFMDMSPPPILSLRVFLMRRKWSEIMYFLLHVNHFFFKQDK
ncbi:unnamed protein product [Meloidogyne enterolobii]|uniref:Uncharacterized protein n=1 Tax=Meloidogyne enterolobii TaxID=390850 RepID=A0ACB0Z6H2_MELEN